MTFPEDFPTVRTEIPGGSTSSNETEISLPLDVRDIADVVRSRGKSSSRAPTRFRSTQLGFEAGERTGNTSSSAVCVVDDELFEPMCVLMNELIIFFGRQDM
jgi:hypothetical protein